ncbi:hypothetical protein PHYBLDRAFT_145187 [Phycomyces blakesleeanus NRRL 1555(-)]|uniref:Uncharacterized protein n=1 Tax=Phycomyces blakesleeanus (strain ATCC 8743b / DSM 1359 / FGSC 10004 / NBRC 33097 / NRRL 1555) TaxID=763407 RepID=A0A162PTB5_PHYB8|nr:hypothetical protein PHYBLDRAFT_145187 [Phycomyces blakesleeanus NRRL 1555(-)]OAD73716.1 hypothetical protein PHYBLDRAFT_145187 [Phycomyces blakesleeanus NRRL 1555(-)]|eukprot:XP_018291756.1 hypothetical protein PHYBLDRAFT_145187 [Phycomyces blakesleeanus NRRL 1555(-)]
MLNQARARDRAGITVEDWSRVVWSDESTFTVKSNTSDPPKLNKEYGIMSTFQEDYLDCYTSSYKTWWKKR